METPFSTLRSRAGLCTAAAASLLLLLPVTAGAAPSPPVAATAATAAPGDNEKFRQLTGQLKKLEKRYRGEFAQLRDTRREAKKALRKTKSLRGELAETRRLLAQMAASQYMSSGVEPSVAMLATENPSEVLDTASLVNHLSNNQSARIEQIQSLVQQERQAREQARAKVGELEQAIQKLNKEKARLEELLKKYKPQSPGTGLNGITPRTARMKDEIDREFGPFPMIGCLRPGDPLDHGSGTACDFMITTGGQMPDAAGLAKGDQVANYAIKHASRLGVKYVIWKQRIYDIRTGGGWSGMSDRGSVTANHWDHPHISMF